MKNKNAFTLVELLATLVILGVLLAIAVPTVGRYLKQGKNTYYHGLETDTLAAGRDYLLDYKSLLPREIEGVTVVTLKELIDNHYIDPLKDEDGNECDGEISVVKVGKNDYEYHACLSCGKKYQSDSKECEVSGNNNTDKDYTINLNEELATVVKQGDFLSLPTATVIEKVGGVETIADASLEPVPRMIDTNALGNTTVTWTYRSKKITRSVQVVDSVAPVIESLRLSYSSASDYDGSITNRDLVLKITAKDYACPLGSDCRKRYPNLEGSGISGIYYKQKNATEWNVYATQKNRTTVPLKNTLWGEIEVKVVDMSGNSSEIQILQIQVDKYAPLKPEIKYLKGENSKEWQKEIQIELNAIDDVGIRYYEIYKDDIFYGTTGSIWIPPNNFSSDNITFRAIDISGNKGSFSAPQKIHVDNEEPSVPFVNLNGYTSGVWTSQDIKLSFSARDNGKIDYYEYADSDYATTGTKISNPWIFTEDGIWTVYIRAIDTAGNIGPWSNQYIIILDKKIPSIPEVSYLSGESSSAWQNNIRIKLSANDNRGIRYYEIYKDGLYYGTTGEVWVPPNNFSSENVTFRAVDIVGNKGDFSVPQKIHMNTEQPTLSESYWGSVTNKLAPLYIKVTDCPSGINRIQCQTSTSDGGFNNWEWVNAVWDSSENAYRCDITPETFGHYNQTYLTNIYIYDNIGHGGYYTQHSITIPGLTYKLSQAAKTGDYVMYKPPSTNYQSPKSLNGNSNQTINPSNYTGLWQVLYNNSNYGLQIVSSEVTAQLSIYGYTGMNNIYSTLNNAASAYMDGIYAISARHIGTNPSNPNDPSDWCYLEGEPVKCSEKTVYLTDLNALKNARSQNANGIAATNKDYFLVSRQNFTCNPTTEEEDKTSTTNCYCITDSRTQNGLLKAQCPVTYPNEKRITNGIRPVITLSNETLVIGNGTFSNPYVIQY